MRRSALPLFLIIALAAISGLSGCNTTDDVIQPSDTQVETDVPAGAAAVSLAGPTSDASARMIDDMLGLLRNPPPLAPARGVAAQEVHPVCPEQFELQNGISGSCSFSAEGVVTFLFGGTLTLEGGAVTVEGTLVGAPAETQPESGLRYTIDYDAYASGSRGSATWSALGTVTLNDQFQVTDFSFNMTHTVTPTGGPSAVVEVVLSPTRFELIVTGPLGGVVRFLLDRDTMSGMVSINGHDVAEVVIVDGCSHIDFINENLDSVVVCPDEGS
jgi:hypothetical protein